MCVCFFFFFNAHYLLENKQKKISEVIEVGSSGPVI